MAAQLANHVSNRRRILLRCMLANVAMALVASRASSAIIDFETTPAGVAPIDDLVLLPATPYIFPGLQISFAFDSNFDNILEPAYFEHAGPDPLEPPNAGFSGYDAGVFANDTADAGFTGQLGNYFLRGPAGATDFGLFVITYSGTTTVTAASGEIWDIDGTAQVAGGPGDTEEYTVQAFDSANNLLATQISPLGTLTSSLAPLDGQPWTFSFSGLSAGIAKIVIDFTGTKPMGIGLAFNNFNPTEAAVPEPTSAVLLILGTLALVTLNRRSVRLNEFGARRDTIGLMLRSHQKRRAL